MARKHVENTEFGSPFAYKTIEDLVMINSTRFWKNSNVRVLGKVCYSEMDDVRVFSLESPLQASNMARLALNVEVLNNDLPQGRLLEIFGYVDILPPKERILTVLFHRNVSGVSISSYYKAIHLRNQRAPQFNDEDDEMPLSPAQCSDNNDEIPLSQQLLNASPS